MLEAERGWILLCVASPESGKDGGFVDGGSMNPRSMPLLMMMLSWLLMRMKWLLLRLLMRMMRLLKGSMGIECEGGVSKEKRLSLFIREDGGLAMWRCFRGKCGWSGSIQDGKMFNVGPNQTSKGKKYRVLTEQGLQLEPLCEEDYWTVQ